MARYKLGHPYSSFTGGRQFGPWAKGDEVELDDADAKWIERDSPGALAPVRKAAAKKALAKQPAKGGGENGA